MTPSETEALKRIYSDDTDPEKRVEYLRFCSDVDRVFTTKVILQSAPHNLTNDRDSRRIQLSL